MSNPHIQEYCDHRSSCSNKTCQAKARSADEADQYTADDIAYRDGVHCSKFKNGGTDKDKAEKGSGEVEGRGADIVLTGVWKKRSH